MELGINYFKPIAGLTQIKLLSWILFVIFLIQISIFITLENVLPTLKIHINKIAVIIDVNCNV